MKRKRHHRSGSDGLAVVQEPVVAAEERRESEDHDEGEDRLEQLLEAAAAGMPEASDGEGDGQAPIDHEHSDMPVSDSVVEKTTVVVEKKTVVVETDMAIDDVEAVEEELALPNMRRLLIIYFY